MAKIKKTRNGKKIAELRRQLEAVTPSQAPSSHREKTYTFSQTTTYNVKSFTPVQTYSYIFSDLKKTAILSIIAIASQIVIYFLLRSVS